MAEEHAKTSPQETVKFLSRAGVPQSIFFYVVLGVIAAARKLLHTAVAAGCMPGDVTCVDFTDVDAGTELASPFEKEGFTFNALDQQELRIIGWGVPSGQAKLLVRNDGVGVELPYPANRVAVRGAQYTRQPLVLKAYDDDGEMVDEATAPAVENVLHSLVAEGATITRIALRGGGGEGLLFDICVPTQEATAE